MTDIGIQAFVETTGASEEKIKDLMQKETWLDPKEALELHIATSIYGVDLSQGVSQSVRMGIVQLLTTSQPTPREPDPKKPTNTLSKFFA